jgi:glycosyltransferase involved in cell wall biosynthesis
VSGELGGIEHYILRVAAALKDEDDLAIELCLKRTARFDPRPEFERAFASAAAPVVMVDPGSWALLRAIWRADLVHMQNYSPDVAAIARVLRRTLVVTVHGHRPTRPPGRVRVGERLARFAVARWYNSDFTWRTWEGNAPRQSSRRISMRPDLDGLGEVPVEDRRGFIFIGRWVANKGIEHLVEAYAAADLDRKEWPLTLLSDGPLRSTIEAQIEAADVTVEAPGYVDDLEKAERLRHARWLVAPSNTQEDLGLTPLEARALGVPAIVTRDGGLPEAAGCFSLVVAPGDPVELRLALEYAAGMSLAEYKRLSTATKDLLELTMCGLAEHAGLYRLCLAGADLAHA